MKWISVEDETPPSKVRVLAHCRHSETHDWILTDAYFDPSKGWFSCGYHQSIFEVIHWHYLSDIPKESEIKKNEEGSGFILKGKSFDGSCCSYFNILSKPPIDDQ